MEDVQLFDEELDAARYQVVGHVVAVYLDNGRHDQQVSVSLENVLELVGGVDDGGHAVSDDHAVPGMQRQAAVENVQEELDVFRMGEISCHCLEHPGYEADPIEFVEDVNTMQLLEYLNFLLSSPALGRVDRKKVDWSNYRG